MPKDYARRNIILTAPSLDQLALDYRNTSEHNDALYLKLGGLTWANPYLAAHRRHIESNRLGFGDPAFHAMWLRLLEAAAHRFGEFRALEIGVYKGQVISLWSLLAKQLSLPMHISAITPLKGHGSKRSILRKIQALFSPKIREELANGNFYAEERYDEIIRDLFQHFGLSFEEITLHQGFSTDSKILSILENETYHLVYVDGDHTYSGALHDFRIFGAKVVPGGWLVADDASYNLPGTKFWKGHQSVSRASEVLPSLGFKNILNVGHNRIFEKVSAEY